MPFCENAEPDAHSTEPSCVTAERVASVVPAWPPVHSLMDVAVETMPSARTVTSVLELTGFRLPLLCA